MYNVRIPVGGRVVEKGVLGWIIVPRERGRVPLAGFEASARLATAVSGATVRASSNAAKTL